MLSNIKIPHRVALLLAAPLLAIIFLSGEAIHKDYEIFQRNAFLSTIAEVVVELGELSHALQVERGATADFLGGAETEAPRGLIESREKTDHEFKRFHGLVETIKQGNHQEITAGLDRIEADVSGISKFRKINDAKGISVDNSMSHYSKIVDDIIELGFHASGYSSNTEISLSIVALLNLSELKEYAGLEHSFIAGALSKNKISYTQFITFNQYIAQQELAQTGFIANEPDRHRAEYKKLLTKIGDNKVRHFRKIINTDGPKASSYGVDAEEWYDATAKRIDALRKIEMLAMANIQKEVHGLSDATYESMITDVLICAALLIFVLLFGWGMSRSISRPILNISNSMNSLANNDYDVEIGYATRRDEIGSMARSVGVFKENGLAVQKLSEQKQTQDAEDLAKAKLMERFREELGQVVQAVIAGDFSHRIAIDFEDMEINELGSSVNNLVSKVDEGLSGAGIVLSALANLDLSQRVEGDFLGAFAKLRDDTNHLADTLSESIGSLYETSSSVKAASGEIQNSSKNLATRTETQAVSVEQTAAAVEEITTTVKSATERAVEASNIVVATKADAERSGVVVDDAIQAMQQIEKSSSEITSIISVIEDISFQTSLLALNAGVEAARAGDAGKGFAVVAQEVRELAQRSDEAAKEIKNLISTSGREVENGVKLVNETGVVLKKIVGEVQQINDHVLAIVGSAKEQSTRLQEINQSVNTIDKGTQQNAVMAEEAMAASYILADDVTKIDNTLSKFRTGAASKQHQPDDVQKPIELASKRKDRQSNSIVNGMNGNAAIDVENWEDF